MLILRCPRSAGLEGPGHQRGRHPSRRLLRKLVRMRNWQRRLGLERAHREIPQPQIGVAALLPDAEHRPVQGLAQHVVALAYGDANALAEETALDEGAAGEGAAIAGIRAVDPERERDGVAEDEIDLALAQGAAHS